MREKISAAGAAQKSTSWGSRERGDRSPTSVAIAIDPGKDALGPDHDRGYQVVEAAVSSRISQDEVPRQSSSSNLKLQYCGAGDHKPQDRYYVEKCG